MDVLLTEGINDELLEEIAGHAREDDNSVEDEVITLLSFGVASKEAAAAARNRDNQR